MKVIVIPARFASTRLPEKMLRKVHDKPIIQWTYEAVRQAPVDRIVIAVDHPHVFECVSAFGAEVMMTSVHHATGSDRVIEVIQQLALADDDLVVNVQGDEPFLPLANVMQLFDTLERQPEVQVATLCEKIHTLEEALSPSIVKVVRDCNNFALYFSRAPIPFARGVFPGAYPDSSPCERHLGLYGYRVGFLKHYSDLKPSPLEALEFLEQLRILYNGIKIHVEPALLPSGPGIDTLEDLQRFEELLRIRSS